MENNISFLIDVLTILPENVDCFIQAPSLEDKYILNLMINTKLDYYKQIKINKIVKQEIIKRIKNFPITQYFQSIVIYINDIKIFEGYDGFEYGIISKNLSLPSWFKTKHIITENCSISKDW